MTQSKAVLRNLPARACYSLPILRRHDPRKRVKPLRELAHRTDRLIFKTDHARDWYIPVRDGEILHREPSIFLDDRDRELFAKSVARFNEGASAKMPEVALACLHKAQLYSDDFLVICRGNHILYESALSCDDLLERNGIFRRIIHSRATDVPGDLCLLACAMAPKNYYEWMFGVLPRLSVIEQFPQLADVPLVVPEKLLAYQARSLQLLGVPKSRLTPFNHECWKIDRLFYPELLSPIGSPSPHAARWLRTRLAEHVTIPQARSSRRLFISRRDTNYRILLNEDEIAGYLADHGFETICPGELDLVDQIRVFSEASVVIGPHGAAFSNMLFAPKGATLIELFGDNYLHGCYWALANLCGHRHAVLTGPHVSLNYRVSLQRVNALLDKVLG